MEPLTIATAFASIVGLICNFKQERQSNKQATKDEFIDWLDKHQHYQIKEYLVKNTSLCQAIESLLMQNHEIVLEKLEFIGEQLSFLLSHIEGFNQIVSAINPSCQLSDQALSLLNQLNNSTASEMLKLDRGLNYDTTLILLCPGGGGLNIDEPKFLKDDLSVLVSLGLLILNYNSKGNEVYTITRNAVKLLEAINIKENE